MTYIIDAHQDISFNGRQVSKRDFFKKNNIKNLNKSGDFTLSQSDYFRLIEGGVKIVFSVIFPYLVKNNGFVKVNSDQARLEMHEQIEYYHELEKTNPNKIKIIKSKKDLLFVMENKNIVGLILLLEDAIGISPDLSELRDLYKKGIRIIGPVWNEDNHFAGGTNSNKGVTKNGLNLLKSMEKIGFALDTAHMNKKSFSESLNNFSGTVINSHTGVSKAREHIRNLSDEQLIQLKEKNGVIGIPFVPDFLHSKISDANLSHFKKHLDHVINIIGIDHVAFGSDFDGMSWPQYMKDVQDVSFFRKAVDYLSSHYSKKDLEKITHKNWEKVIYKIYN